MKNKDINYLGTIHYFQYYFDKSTKDLKYPVRQSFNEKLSENDWISQLYKILFQKVKEIVQNSLKVKVVKFLSQLPVSIFLSKNCFILWPWCH